MYITIKKISVCVYLCMSRCINVCVSVCTLQKSDSLYSSMILFFKCFLWKNISVAAGFFSPLNYFQCCSILSRCFHSCHTPNKFLPCKDFWFWLLLSFLTCFYFILFLFFLSFFFFFFFFFFCYSTSQVNLNPDCKSTFQNIFITNLFWFFFLFSFFFLNKIIVSIQSNILGNLVFSLI